MMRFLVFIAVFLFQYTFSTNAQEPKSIINAHGFNYMLWAVNDGNATTASIFSYEYKRLRYKGLYFTPHLKLGAGYLVVFDDMFGGKSREQFISGFGGLTIGKTSRNLGARLTNDIGFIMDSNNGEQFASSFHEFSVHSGNVFRRIEYSVNVPFYLATWELYPILGGLNLSVAYKIAYLRPATSSLN